MKFSDRILFKNASHLLSDITKYPCRNEEDIQKYREALEIIPLTDKDRYLVIGNVLCF